MILPGPFSLSLVLCRVVSNDLDVCVLENLTDWVSFADLLKWVIVISSDFARFNWVFGKQFEASVVDLTHVSFTVSSITWSLFMSNNPVVKMRLNKKAVHVQTIAHYVMILLVLIQYKA